MELDCNSKQVLSLTVNRSLMSDNRLLVSDASFSPDNGPLHAVLVQLQVSHISQNTLTQTGVRTNTRISGETKQPREPAARRSAAVSGTTINNDAQTLLPQQAGSSHQVNGQGCRPPQRADLLEPPRFYCSFFLFFVKKINKKEEEERCFAEK